MTNREKANKAREALKDIGTYIFEATSSDRNPNKGDLFRIGRIAADALRETK